LTFKAQAQYNYFPFGSVMDGRSFNNEKYRFGFNGQEKDNDIGEGMFSAEFWEYDSRIARRWNPDPIVKKYESFYACFSNNPILFVDPNGQDVVNGDEIRSKKQAKKVNGIQKKVDQAEKEFGTKRKSFKKSGNKEWKKEWKDYKTNKQNLEFDKGNLKFYQEASKKTSEIIDFWKKSSPLLFDKVDKATNEFGNKVDFVLGTENSIEEGYYGATMFEYGKYSKNSAGESGYIPWSHDALVGGSNKVVVRINPNVMLNQKDKLTGQYSLNHEAGHFLYFVANTTKYVSYLKLLEKNNRGLNGGHNKDDESGKLADKYGKKKDL